MRPNDKSKHNQNRGPRRFDPKSKPQRHGGPRPHKGPRHGSPGNDARPRDGEGEKPRHQQLYQHRDQRPYREQHDDGIIRLFGFHAVEAALKNPARKLLRIHLTDNAENRLADALKARGLTPERVDPRDLDRRLGSDTVHQGALLEAEPLPQPSLEELATRASTSGPVVVLDQVTDPQNVGAILRSAAAFGSAGVVTTQRHSPPLSGALAKSASGALEHIPVALVPNLARSLEQLAELGLTRIGLDGDATDLIEDQDLKSSVALVLGAEGKGLRRLTRELCDRLCRITTGGPLQSLNVSNAAAIALHRSAVQRRS